MTKKKKKLKIDSLWNRLRKDTFEVKKPKKMPDLIITEDEPKKNLKIIIPKNDSSPYDEVNVDIENKLLNN